MSILEVNHIKKVYKTRMGGDEVTALRDVHFSVEPGEFVAIMGESGSGKTTLLNILASLDTPTAGKVLVDGKDFTTLKDNERAIFRRSNLGFIFQDFNLLDNFSIEDNIKLPLVLAGEDYKKMDTKVAKVAGQLGIVELLKKYPGHPGFMKFKCRFLMEDAGENRIEAERFLDKALKMFPEDGYFLKYKADILWMDGEMQKAAELYLQVKNKTTNGIVWMEMDRFFRGYKSEILKSCEELIANHNKKEALALMELWSRLIPEDDDIQGALYLAKTVCARTQSEIEKEIGEIRAVIGTQMITPVSVEKNPGKSRKQIKSDRTSDETSADDVNKKVSDPSAETEEVKAPADIQVKVSEEHKMYRKALTRAWKRLGYSDELAELRTQIICTGEESELEWLAEQVRNRQFRREEKACAYKLVGDVRMKQGQTREAFANYRKALEYEMPSYVRTELYRIFINDLRFS